MLFVANLSYVGCANLRGKLEKNADFSTVLHNFCHAQAASAVWASPTIEGDPRRALQALGMTDTAKGDTRCECPRRKPGKGDTRIGCPQHPKTPTGDFRQLLTNYAGTSPVCCSVSTIRVSRRSWGNRVLFKARSVSCVSKNAFVKIHMGLCCTYRL